jgi:asparagine synthetase B (glutamine-hydrolysing)
MCSFIFSNRPFTQDNLNTLSSKRGPDHTEFFSTKKFNFIHNLLDISNHKIIQPITKDGITLLYNGEIYEPHASPDTLSIIPLYQKYGPCFVNKINGEYAILLLDETQNLLYLYSDIFATKPLFYSIEGSSIGVASYASELKILGFKNIQRVEHSSFLTINLTDLTTKKVVYHSFNLEEHKITYDDCILALEKSLELRCNTKVAVGLSSGHDSGSILLWSYLKKKTNNSFYFVTNNREDLNVMKLREKYCIDNNLQFHTLDYFKNKDQANTIELQLLSKYMEEFSYFFKMS